MSKIVITIEDKPGGGVKVVSNPNFETMCSMVASGGGELTSAHAYAFTMLKAGMVFSRDQGKQSSILIPRLGKA